MGSLAAGPLQLKQQWAWGVHSANTHNGRQSLPSPTGCISLRFGGIYHVNSNYLQNSKFCIGCFELYLRKMSGQHNKDKDKELAHTDESHASFRGTPEKEFPMYA